MEDALVSGTNEVEVVVCEKVDCGEAVTVAVVLLEESKGALVNVVTVDVSSIGAVLVDVGGCVLIVEAVRAKFSCLVMDVLEVLLRGVFKAAFVEDSVFVIFFESETVELAWLTVELVEVLALLEDVVEAATEGGEAFNVVLVVFIEMSVVLADFFAVVSEALLIRMSEGVVMELATVLMIIGEFVTSFIVNFLLKAAVEVRVTSAFDDDCVDGIVVFSVTCKFIGVDLIVLASLLVAMIVEVNKCVLAHVPEVFVDEFGGNAVETSPFEVICSPVLTLFLVLPVVDVDFVVSEFVVTAFREVDMKEIVELFTK